MVEGEKTMTSTVAGTVTKFNATDLKPWSTYLITACGFNRKRTDKSIVYGKSGNLTVNTHLARMCRWVFPAKLLLTLADSKVYLSLYSFSKETGLKKH